MRRAIEKRARAVRAAAAAAGTAMTSAATRHRQGVKRVRTKIPWPKAGEEVFVWDIIWGEDTFAHGRVISVSKKKWMVVRFDDGHDFEINFRKTKKTIWTQDKAARVPEDLLNAMRKAAAAADKRKTGEEKRSYVEAVKSPKDARRRRQITNSTQDLKARPVVPAATTTYDDQVASGLADNLIYQSPTILDAVLTADDAARGSTELEAATKTQSLLTPEQLTVIPVRAVNLDLYRSFKAPVVKAEVKDDYPNEVGNGMLVSEPPVFTPGRPRNKSYNVAQGDTPATPLLDPSEGSEGYYDQSELDELDESVVSGGSDSDVGNISVESIAGVKMPKQPTNALDKPKKDSMRLSFDEEKVQQTDMDNIAAQMKGRCSTHGIKKCQFKDTCLTKLKFRFEDLFEVCQQHRKDQYDSYQSRGGWWFSRLHQQRVAVNRHDNPRGWKYDLRYRIEGIEVCKNAFFVFYGYNPENRLSKTHICNIRKGRREPCPPKGQVKNIMRTATEGCTAWIHEYISRHTDTPPVTYGKIGRAVVPASTILHRYLLYKKDETDGGRLVKASAGYVEYDCFRKHWNNTRTIKLNGHTYKLEERSSKTKGYPKCDKCEGWHLSIMNAPDKKTRERMRYHLRRHWAEVHSTRRQYAINIAASKNMMAGWRVASVAMDACDQAKTRIPLTGSDAKSVQGLFKVKLKLTGVIIHGAKKGYHMYITPPWVKTGFNINASIIVDLLARKVVDLQTTNEIRMQVDGASDNVCTYMVYLWTHYLLWAQETGHAFSCVRVSRLIVGHTHFDVDQLFSVLSVALFGTKTRSRRRLDVYTLEAFLEIVKNAFGTNLQSIKYVGAMYDYKRRYEKVRTNNQLESGIKEAFVYELSTSSLPGDVGKVFWRSKPRMGDRYQWSPKSQWFPHRDGVKRSMPPMNPKPTRAKFKKWKYEKGGAKVIKDYLKFAEIKEMRVTAAQKMQIHKFVNSIPDKARHVAADLMPRATVEPGNGTGTHVNEIQGEIQDKAQDEETADMEDHLNSRALVPIVVAFNLTNAEVKTKRCAVTAARAALEAAAAVRDCLEGDVKLMSEMAMVKQMAAEIAEEIKRKADEIATKKMFEKVKEIKRVAAAKTAALKRKISASKSAKRMLVVKNKQKRKKPLKKPSTNKRKKPSPKPVHAYRSNGKFQLGDLVTCKAHLFGEESAKRIHGAKWKTAVDHGVVVARDKKTNQINVEWTGAEKMTCYSKTQHLKHERPGNETAL